MVAYIGTEQIQKLVAAVGPARFLADLAQEIEADFRRWPAFDKCARLASHSEVGVIELMPVSDGRHYAFKYVNGHPRNTTAGLLTVTGFGVLADVATGYPLLLSEMTYATALRTAATSLLAAEHLARPDARAMALIGNGAQSEFQAIAFHVFGIRTLRLYDTDPGATARLVRNLARLALPGLAVIPCTGIADAVRGADIVTTVTADKRRAVVLTPEMVAPGMHVNALGGDCPGKTELHPAILRRPDARVVVEYTPQTRVEGEIQQLDPDFPVIELADVIRGVQPGRTAPDQVTVFDSVGFALEDFAVLRYLHRLMEDMHVMRTIDLVPVLDDPKDLFGALGAVPFIPPLVIFYAHLKPRLRVCAMKAPTERASTRCHSAEPINRKIG